MEPGSKGFGLRASRGLEDKGVSDVRRYVGCTSGSLLSRVNESAGQKMRMLYGLHRDYIVVDAPASRCAPVLHPQHLGVLCVGAWH